MFAAFEQSLSIGFSAEAAKNGFYDKIAASLLNRRLRKE
jgi:hypothetical protein